MFTLFIREVRVLPTLLPQMFELSYISSKFITLASQLLLYLRMWLHLGIKPLMKLKRGHSFTYFKILYHVSRPGQAWEYSYLSVQHSCGSTLINWLALCTFELWSYMAPQATNIMALILWCHILKSLDWQPLDRGSIFPFSLEPWRWHNW